MMSRIAYLLVFLISSFQLLASWDSGLSSLCSLSSNLDCGSVTTTSYGYFLSLPLSFWAMMWSGVGLWQSSRPDKALFSWNLIGLLASFYSLTVMTLVLQKYCVLCLAIDALLIFIFLSYRKSYLVPWSWKLKDVTTGLALPLGLSGVLYLYSHYQVVPVEKSSVSQEETVLLLDSPLILGNLKGKKVAVVFTDFQCPACKKAEPIVKQLLQDPEVQVVVKNYPLSSQCNSGMKQDLHPWSCIAAKLSYCAHEQGMFKEFYALVYENQTSIKDEKDLLLLLGKNFFDVEQLTSCSSGSWAEERVQADLKEGNQINIQGTPTFFYNQKQVNQWNNPFVWEQLLKQSVP